MVSDVQLSVSAAASAPSTRSRTLSVPDDASTPGSIAIKCDKLTAQVMALTTDVIEREEQLMVLRQSISSQEQYQLHEEDIIKELMSRLAQVLIEKEDMKESIMTQLQVITV